MKKYLLLVSFVLLATVCPGQQYTFDVELIQNNGPSSNRLDLVIVGDGYTEDQLDKESEDAHALINTIMATEIFGKFHNYFNAHLIKVVSNESGATHPGFAGDEPDTAYHPIKQVDNYFGSSFDFAGFHRLMSISKNYELQMVLANNVPEYDMIIIMVNTEFYGGGSGNYTIVTQHPLSAEILLHEMGHTLAGLADEYEEPGGTPRERQNVTQETNPQLIRWKNWLDESTPLPTPETEQYAETVGLFEGAAYNPVGWYRPKLDCKMNHLEVPFCEVCNEALLTNVYRFVNPIDEWSPQFESYTATTETSIDFTIDLIEPFYDINWTVNGQNLDIHSKTVRMDFTSSSSTKNVIRAIVTDTTRLTRGEPIQFDTTWTVFGALKQVYYPPEIQSFSPATASSNDLVTIRLSPLKQDVAVSDINISILDEVMTIERVTPDSISFRVPSKALKGPIVVHYGSQTDTSTGQFQTRPKISSITPTTGQGGDVVTIEGSNFSEIPTENTVLFGEIAADIIETSSTQLRVHVPQIAESSLIGVAYSGLSATSQEMFQLELITDLASPRSIVSAGAYPNPSDGRFTIRIPEEYNGQPNTVELYDLQGRRRHFSIEDTGNIQMELMDLPEGQYILICRNNKYYYKTKLIVNR